MMRLAYPMRFHPEEGGGFWVQGVEPLANVVTGGGDLDHTRAMAREALTGVLETMLDHGKPIPRPPAAEGPGIYWIEPEPEVVAPILLRWAREDAHVSLGELANRLGVTYQVVQKFERAGANPTLKTLAKVARALGMELRLAMEDPGVAAAARQPIERAAKKGSRPRKGTPAKGTSA